MGYGAAMAVVLFVLLMALTYVMMRASGRLVYYEGAERGG
jgi:ABC-type sugar transport system permease subunit